MKPNVKLIAISDNREQAWKFSRPTFDHSDLGLEKAVSMDMSFNSLCMLTFEITSSIMFRDFLFSIRPLFAWAKSSRDLPFTADNLSISDEFGDWGQDGITRALSIVRSGAHQNTARAYLPATLSTSYTMMMDFRTVCGLIKTLLAIDKDLYGIYGWQFANEIRHIKGFEENKIKHFYDHYALNGSETEDIDLSRIGNMRYGSYRTKSALTSQFLRQSHSIVKTEIWNWFIDLGYLDASKMYQTGLIQVAFYTPIHIYHNLMKLRSHWFADWAPDMWGNIVGDYIKDMTLQEFWEFIPCGNGKPDPFHYHTLKRVTGDDLNSPCPIMLEYPDLVLQRFAEQGENPIIYKYLDLVRYGYIKDNPNNELRKQYVKRIEQSTGKISND